MIKKIFLKFELSFALAAFLIFSIIVGGYILFGRDQGMTLMPAENGTAFDFFEKLEKEKEEILIRIGGKVVDAMMRREYVEFGEANSICAASNRSLPRHFFHVISNHDVFDEIFWMQENQTTRKLSESYDERIVIYIATNDARKYCAMVTDDAWTGPAKPYQFLCLDDLVDSENRFILFRNKTIGCVPLKIKREHMVGLLLGRFGTLDETYVLRDLRVKPNNFLADMFSGYTLGEYFANETGIEWCKNQPTKLSPGRRLIIESQEIITAYSYSRAVTLCLPKI